MISYELALRLKEAGFPQGLLQTMFCQTHKRARLACDTSCNEPSEHCCIPTISKLIEAIGTPLFLHCEMYDYWYAQDGKTDKAKEGRGRSADEALTELWLAKNK